MRFDGVARRRRTSDKNHAGSVRRFLCRSVEKREGGPPRDFSSTLALCLAFVLIAIVGSVRVARFAIGGGATGLSSLSSKSVPARTGYTSHGGNVGHVRAGTARRVRRKAGGTSTSICALVRPRPLIHCLFTYKRSFVGQFGEDQSKSRRRSHATRAESSLSSRKHDEFLRGE